MKNLFVKLMAVFVLFFTSCENSTNPEETTSLNIHWINIPQGQFTWGSDDDSRSIEYDYEISKYEITNAQYLIYLEQALVSNDIVVTDITVEGFYEGETAFPAGTYEYLDLDGHDCGIVYSNGKFSIKSGYKDHPVVEVSWFGAFAFAHYYGWNLPTDEEWEKAARGNTGFDYPWGDTIDSTNANYWKSEDPYEKGVWKEYPLTTPAGYFNGSIYNNFQTTDSPSPYGAYDMAGNVGEWTMNDTTISRYRTVRGGNWDVIEDFLYTWDQYKYPASGQGYIGFRVCRIL